MDRLLGLKESQTSKRLEPASRVLSSLWQLEALCERMETSSIASHKSTEDISKRAAHMSTDSPNEEMETSENDGNVTLIEPPGIQQ